MPQSSRAVPTIDRPFRAIPIDVQRTTVQGEYQSVVALPESPTKAQLLLALAEACRSLAELAEKWASEEGEVAEKLVQEPEDRDYRIDFRIALHPEGGVDHDKVSTFAPQFQGL